MSAPPAPLSPSRGGGGKHPGATRAFPGGRRVFRCNSTTVGAKHVAGIGQAGLILFYDSQEISSFPSPAW